jgi:hypothetical protein
MGSEIGSSILGQKGSPFADGEGDVHESEIQQTLETSVWLEIQSGLHNVLRPTDAGRCDLPHLSRSCF